MLAIVRFNWPFYVMAVVVFCGMSGALVFLPDGAMRVLAILGGVGAGYFIFVSLGVSHLVYDRSDLYCWGWLERALNGAKRERMIFCHAGFDEASAALGGHLDGAEWEVLDHYDAAKMTESSIKRARALFPPTRDTIAAKYDNWPVKDGWADVVFGILAIHELRSVEERAGWFAEAGRCLGEGGRVIVVEHVRDLANFMAFGPGFLHFHAVKQWELSWEAGGLRLIDEFRVTPWIRVFVINKR